MSRISHALTNIASIAATLAALFACGNFAYSQTPTRPNILYIMADDHAAHAISAYGSRINKTPNLDRIANEGLRLENCFCVNSICTPSRACILTGKYSHKNGVPVFNAIDPEAPTVAKDLQAAGYYTAMVGKWHLGTVPNGFDRWLVLPGQGDYKDPVLCDAAGSHKFSGYVTDIITDQAIDVIKNRPKDKPFFLMCHHKAPHRNWIPDDKHAEMYDGEDIPEPDTLRDDYSTRTDAAREATMRIGKNLTKNDLKADPPPGLSEDELLKWKYERFIKDYLRCVASIDDNVGRLLKYLDDSGLAKNTVVIYTSDQGFFLGDHGWFDKRFFYEESIRMPFLIRWPGVIKPGSDGKGGTVKEMVLNVDFAPTFLEIAGAAVPKDMQGRSFVPLLHGLDVLDWRKSWYYRYYHDPGDHNTRAHYGVRTETHKLIYFWKKDQWECYDLIHDPKELHNIYNDPASAALVADLKKELYRLKKEVQDNDEYAARQPTTGVGGPPKGTAWYKQQVEAGRAMPPGAKGNP
jgi:arylsulfatase A-like enzyme